jgi:hypothetical protein
MAVRKINLELTIRSWGAPPLKFFSARNLRRATEDDSLRNDSPYERQKNLKNANPVLHSIVAFLAYA